jgi:ketosteroid isomerase-like protein
MTLPKGWKKEQPTTKKEPSSQQKEQTSSKIEQTSSKIEQTSSTITIEDKIIIQELIAKYNIALDNKNIDDWTNTWTDDGVWSTPFGEAKGKTELKNMINQVTNEFASGKRHLSTNIIIEDAPDNMTSAKSYLIVTEAKKTPEIVASGAYIDSLKKDTNGKWKFVQRRLEIDLVTESD